MKPMNSPAQRQPNPRNIRVKVAFRATFSPQQIVFSWVGIDIIQETDYKIPNPTKILRKHPTVK